MICMSTSRLVVRKTDARLVVAGVEDHVVHVLDGVRVQNGGEHGDLCELIPACTSAPQRLL